MNEAQFYCLISFLPPFLLRLATDWLPVRWRRLRWLLFLYPAALLILAAASLASGSGPFIAWNVLAAVWLAIMAVLSLTGYGLAALLWKWVRRQNRR